jgi:hypothetical protein
MLWSSPIATPDEYRLKWFGLNVSQNLDIMLINIPTILDLNNQETQLERAKILF